MQFLYKFFLVTTLFSYIPACTAIDPSVNDLKSPCVGEDGAPCVRRPLTGVIVLS